MTAKPGALRTLVNYSASTAVARLTSTAASDCEPCAAATLAEDGEGEESETAPPEAVDAPAPRYWAGAIVIENEMTGDGRMIEDGALRWEDLPIPLRLVSEDSGAHDGAVTVGRILTIERQADGVIWGTGDFDVSSEAGLEAARLIEDEVQNGVSVDLDDVSFKIEVAAEVIEEIDALMAGEGEDTADEPDAEVRQTSEDGERVVVAEINSDDEVMVTTGARVRAATMVSIPAFSRARIYSAEAPESGESADGEVSEDEALVAGGNFRRPPAEWFDNPNLPGPTAITVTEDGRIYGHVATWGTCHISHSHQGCITPPHTRTNYARYRVGAVLTAEGTTVPTGKITMGSGHAGPRLTAQAATAHYDNTGTAAADVAAGEDSHGIWIAGAVRSTLSEAQVAELRASPLSGDWRTENGNLEMVHVLAVNVGGFPVPRTEGLVASGEIQSLVASGIVMSESMLPEEKSLDIRYLHRLVEREKSAEARTLSRRVQESTLALRARKIKEMSH